VRSGVLTHEIAPETVDDSIERAGRGEKQRRLLPARSTTYFVLAVLLLAVTRASRR